MFQNEGSSQFIARTSPEIVTTEAPLTKVQPRSYSAIDALQDFGVTGFIVICSLFFVMLSKRSKRTNKKVYNFQQTSEVPCRNCQFFSHNPYLKCAVNPSTTMTARAIDCSDYRPQQHQ
jgi:hypothetical protein